MKAWIGDRKEPPKFEAPGNIVFVPSTKGSGDPALEGTPGAITEAFIAGTQPMRFDTMRIVECGFRIARLSNCYSAEH